MAGTSCVGLSVSGELISIFIFPFYIFKKYIYLLVKQKILFG
jgi:hypothetical protein